MFKALLERVRRGVGVVSAVGRDIRYVAGKHSTVKRAGVVTSKSVDVLD
jgi:hypothetical protein